MDTPLAKHRMMNRLIVVSLLLMSALMPANADKLMDNVRRNLDAVPQVRDSYIRYGSQYAGQRWTSPSAHMFAEFKTNGNRTRYEAATFAKRRQLAALVMAEIAEDKGRFMDDIIDGLQSTLEETWWGIPAHYPTKMMRREDQNVDLFNAETAGLVAWTKRALKEKIDSFSPMMTKWIDDEIARRMLAPALATDYWWKKAGMNWNPWICSNWLACVMFCERDSVRRQQAIEQIDKAMQCFYNAYPDDGGCDEGPTYWDRAAASLFDCLYLRNDGNSRDFADAKLARMAAYSYATYIADGYCLSFADSHGNRMVQQPNVMYPFAVMIGDKTMARFAAYVAKEKAFMTNAAAIFHQSGNYPTLGRELVFLSMLDTFVNEEAAEPLLADTWLQRLQIMTARRNGVFLAMKGGHNDESHNHNDVGSFVVYDGGIPVLVDPGVGEYTSMTFSKRRYDIWTMQSAYHNLPQINGCDQQAGRKYASHDVEYRLGRLKMDLAKTYPDSAGINCWTRVVDIDKRGVVTLSDDYDLSRCSSPVRLMFIAAHEPRVKAGEIEIGTMKMKYDTTILDVAVEPLDGKFDPMLRQMWQDGLWRIVMSVKGNSKRGKVKITVARGTSPYRR